MLKIFFLIFAVIILSGCAQLNGGGGGARALSISAAPASSRSHEEWLQLGDSFASSDKYISAGQAYKKALELQPNHLKTHGALCSTMVLVPDFDEAIEHCKVALGDPLNYTAVFNIAQAYEGIWYLKGAKTYYQKYAKDVGKDHPDDEFVQTAQEKLNGWKKIGKVNPGQDVPFSAEEKAQFEQYREHLLKMWPTKSNQEAINHIEKMVYSAKNNLRMEGHGKRAIEIRKLLQSDPWSFMRGQT